MSLKSTIAAFLLLFIAASLPAQIKGGFKTGLNFANIKGPSETDNAGNSLESWKNNVGFHIGATFSYHFTDNYGLRGELIYSKKGTQYSYEGPGFRRFNYTGGSTLTTGTSKYRINITNAYLDLPITGFARFGDVELSAGVYASLLVQSVGEGSLTFSGNTIPLNNPTGELQFILDQNYLRDDPGQGNSDVTILAQVDSRTLELPKSLGAYYDLTEDKGSYFNKLDYGVTGGITYYLSRSLYASIRLQYGLADITNNNADVSKASTDAQGNLLFRDDQDRNFVIQASVGFNF